MLLQVDNALLTHPKVLEAVAFAAPDEKYGEHVAAAVVLDRKPSNAAAVVADIKAQVAGPNAAVKVCCLIPCLACKCCQAMHQSEQSHEQSMVISGRIRYTKPCCLLNMFPHTPEVRDMSPCPVPCCNIIMAFVLCHAQPGGFCASRSSLEQGLQGSQECMTKLQIHLIHCFSDAACLW